MPTPDTVTFDPPPEEHPEYTTDRPNFEKHDVVIILAYDDVSFDTTDGGSIYHYRLTEPAIERYHDGKTNLRSSHNVVYEVDRENDRVRISTGGLTKTGSSVWVPLSMVVGTDEAAKEMMEARYARREEKRRRQEQAERARDRYIAVMEEKHDLDRVMEEEVIPHAHEVAADVWDGGTVNINDIDFFWNNRLRTSAGKAYRGSSVPNDVDGRLAIGLAPEYFYLHGLDELLAVVRHELIHAWQYEHPDCDGGGHDSSFKQWIDELDTHRHCKEWSR